MLLNVAQTYIKKDDFEEALEYLSRTLYLDPTHVKALSRKAFVHSEQGQIKVALETADKALKIDADNKELQIQVDELTLAVNSLEESERVQGLSDK